ncbi:MAG: hypothetical protein KJ818_04460, partial [Candidatus Omnitrophica bacterium]|nr:hypothetical protein [Candidatus Omnitrophota bacterium]
LNSQSQILNQGIDLQTQSICKELQNFKIVFEQLNCDSKELNQNIYQIKNFFEQIERHLDLKK